MPAIRHLVQNRSLAIVLILAVSLALRLVVPSGYMPTMSHGKMIVSICSGTMTEPMVLEVPGLAQQPDDASHDAPAKHDTPCAYAGLTMAALAAVPLDLLIVALAFTMGSGLRPGPAPVETSRYGLRPWARGPPFPL
ncbi:DUF2946 family protein [Sphingomonas sp. CFBP 13728]|uniref:DUF2946 family protein n=2 Tax=Sphingomonadaceae TaxID=41297 RepID=UPI0031587F1B